MDSFRALAHMNFGTVLLCFWLWMRSYHQFSSKVWIEHVHEKFGEVKPSSATSLENGNSINNVRDRSNRSENYENWWARTARYFMGSQLPMFLRIACRSHLGSLGPHLEETGLRPCWFGKMDIP